MNMLRFEQFNSVHAVERPSPGFLPSDLSRHEPGFSVAVPLVGRNTNHRSGRILPVGVSSTTREYGSNLGVWRNAKTGG